MWGNNGLLFTRQNWFGRAGFSPCSGSQAEVGQELSLVLQDFGAMGSHKQRVRAGPSQGELGAPVAQGKSGPAALGASERRVCVCRQRTGGGEGGGGFERG